MNTVMWSAQTATLRLVKYRSLWLTTQQAAEVLQVSTDRVRAYIEDGRLRAIKPGSRYLVSRGSLARFISYQAQKPRRTRDGGWTR